MLQLTSRVAAHALEAAFPSQALEAFRQLAWPTSAGEVRELDCRRGYRRVVPGLVGEPVLDRRGVGQIPQIPQLGCATDGIGG